MSAQASMGVGLYFIDVFACTLFCLTLALVGARFGNEVTVPLDLPRMDASASSGSDLSGLSIALRLREGELELFFEDEPVSFEELEQRLRAAPPPSVVVRSEQSALARVIGVAHAAGVHDIRLAYETARAAKEIR